MTDFRASAQAVPIESVDQLVEQFHRAGKPRERWMIGTEYEKVAVERASGRAAPFSGPRGIEAVLRGLAERYGWEPKEEDGRVVALAREGASITLEPGAQLELSGEQCPTIHCTQAELATHVREVVSVGGELGIAFLGLGMQPMSPLDEIEWVPKQRYRIMGPYRTRVGTLGQRMMKQTATVQANIDYGDERDAMLKLRVGMGIAPLVNAMFANSSISDGGLNGYMSFRGHVWTDTDRARCGLLPSVFRAGAGFADYVEWALDVPLYFILRGGRYRTEVTGVPFRRFLAEGAAGERATLDDWNLHLTTLFPEVRLKGYIEIRSADSQPPERMLALPALVKGVFYTQDCLEAAWDLVKRWSFEERVALWGDVHREALLAHFKGVKVIELARELYAIAEEGLRRQQELDPLLVERAHALAGQVGDRKAELEEHVLAGARAERAGLGGEPAHVVAGQDDDGKGDRGLRLELLDGGTAHGGLLVEQDRFQTELHQEASDLLLHLTVPAVHDEHLAVRSRLRTGAHRIGVEDARLEPELARHRLDLAEIRRQILALIRCPKRMAEAHARVDGPQVLRDLVRDEEEPQQLPRVVLPGAVGVACLIVPARLETPHELLPSPDVIEQEPRAARESGELEANGLTWKLGHGASPELRRLWRA